MKMDVLYANIKERRKLLKMTQVELAQKTGYTDHTMISKIEKGKVNLSHSKISEFAKALDTTMPELMGWVSPDSEGLIDYYDETLEAIGRLLSDSGYVVHFENYSFNQLAIIEEPANSGESQIFVVREGNLVSEYEQLRIECENVNAKDLITKTVASTTLLSPDEEQLLCNYRKLNNIGKTKAQEDIEDLTLLPKYSDTDDRALYADAAHQRTDIPYNEEYQKIDNDIMDDDNF